MTIIYKAAAVNCESFCGGKIFSVINFRPQILGLWIFCFQKIFVHKVNSFLKRLFFIPYNLISDFGTQILMTVKSLWTKKGNILKEVIKMKLSPEQQEIRAANQAKNLQN